MTLLTTLIYDFHKAISTLLTLLTILTPTLFLVKTSLKYFTGHRWCVTFALDELETKRESQSLLEIKYWDLWTLKKFMLNLNFGSCISLCFDVCSLFHWIFRPNCITAVKLSGAVEPKNPMKQWANTKIQWELIADKSFLFIFVNKSLDLIFLAFTALSILFLCQSLLFSMVSYNVTPVHPAQRSRVTYGM